MDIEHFKHRTFKPSLLVAFALAITVVVVTALIGRGTLNLRGALILPEPRDTTVIALMEPRLEPDETISNIVFLRKEAPNEADSKPRYSYTVMTSAGANYFVQLAFDMTKHEWKINTLENLHGE